jgi:hypothetical protein
VDATQNGDINPGRPLPPRELPAPARRGRFILAAAQLSHDLGPAAVTEGAICRLSGGSEADFGSLFGSAEDCLCQGVDEAGKRLLRPVRESDGRGAWLVEVRSAVAGFYAAVALEPLLAELLLVRSFWVASGRAHPAMLAAAEELRRLIGSGRSAVAAIDPGPPPITDEYYAGAVLWAARRSVERGETGCLVAETRAVVYLIATTYLGAGEARRILADDDGSAGN